MFRSSEVWVTRRGISLGFVSRVWKAVVEGSAGSDVAEGRRGRVVVRLRGGSNCEVCLSVVGAGESFRVRLALSVMPSCLVPVLMCKGVGLGCSRG